MKKPAVAKPALFGGKAPAAILKGTAGMPHARGLLKGANRKKGGAL
jgi:hypothetical protein